MSTYGHDEDPLVDQIIEDERRIAEAKADEDYLPDESPDAFVIELDGDEDVVPLKKKRPLLAGNAALYVEKHRVLDIEELFALPPIEWFVEDFLPHAPRTMIHGLGGSYKSFLTLDWMLCAATARPWHGHAVRPGNVLYIAGEGVQGLGKRVAAWLEHNGYTPGDIKDSFKVMGAPINFGKLQEHAIAVWAGYLDWAEIDYVVIDTLHTATAGAEENSSTEMGLVLANASEVAGENISLFFVHHTVKSGSGHRGSGALRDDMDVVVGMKPVPDADYTGQLYADKIRDADQFPATNIAFKKLGTGLQSALVVDTIQEHAKHVVDTVNKPPTAVVRAKEAIAEHGLDPNRGEKHISDQLRSLNLGLNFAPATVGKALRELRGAAQEVQNMKVRRIDLDPEDQ